MAAMFTAFPKTLMHPKKTCSLPAGGNGIIIPFRFREVPVVKKVDAATLQEIVRRLVAEFQPEAVILFGSHAWGTPTDDSDLDLLVIVSASDEQPAARATRAHRAMGEIRCPMDILVRTREEIEEHRDLRASLMWRIAEEGRLLHGKRLPTTAELAASGRPVPMQSNREKAKVRFARQWMELASEGIGVARGISKGSDGLLTGAAFHCEQSAVKGLSAYLCRHDVRFDQARTLAKLLELCVALDPSFSALDAEAVCLRPFFARYT